MAVLIWWHFLCSQPPGVCERSNGLHGANARGVDWKSNGAVVSLSFAPIFETLFVHFVFSPFHVVCRHSK
uniref:Secreted protein n=1 Tax=Anguilla anguilla TaxID=7936 RepID=A0A0E9X4J8_ANGAN